MVVRTRGVAVSLAVRPTILNSHPQLLQYFLLTSGSFALFLVWRAWHGDYDELDGDRDAARTESQRATVNGPQQPHVAANPGVIARTRFGIGSALLD